MRSLWNGTLRISLVQIPIRVHAAVNTSEQIRFNQLHKNCHHRVRQKLVCPAHGEIARDQIVKGYEYEEGKYCVVDDADLNQVKTEGSGLIDLIQFVDPKELDLALLDTPYYLTPGGIVARGAYAVVREALSRSGRLGLGQVVLSGRERLVIVKPLGKGLVLHTLRYASELRLSTPYFESLADRVDEDQVALAQRLIDNRSAPLDLSAYSDRYQAGLLALIKNKTEGCSPRPVSASSPANNIVNLLDALKQSIAQTRRRASAKKAKQAA